MKTRLKKLLVGFGWTIMLVFVFSGCGRSNKPTTSIATATGYYNVNGHCYSPTGQVVVGQFCGANNVMNMPAGQQCNGTFVNQQGRRVECFGMNCTGQTLVNPMTRTIVYCP